MICVALTGPPGSGKSAAREPLARLLGAESLDIVDFFVAGTSFSDEERWAAYSELVSRLRMALGNGRNVVVEAFLFRAQRVDLLRQTCAEFACPLLMVLLTASLSVLQERVSARACGRLRTDVKEQDVVRFAAEFAGIDADLVIDTGQAPPEAVALSIREEVRRWTRKA